MQRLLKDIKSHKIEVIVAIKVDRLTRNNYDGFWLLNYCEEHDVKIELILEPYDVSTANGEMIFGMNLVFGQRERKEIGARTKRAMEENKLVIQNELAIEDIKSLIYTIRGKQVMLDSDVANIYQRQYCCN